MGQAIQMNVLVTGGAGYIGSHTTHELVNQGFNVIIVDSLENGHRESLPENTKFYQCDLANIELLDEIFKKNKIDAVIHFAGYIEAGLSMKTPLKFFQNNVSNGLNLVKVMIKHKVDKIVFSSSAAVYGQPKNVPIIEEAEKKPTNYYGLTKLMFEQILDACQVYKIKNISLRYFNAAGAGHDIGEDHTPETHLIPLLLQTALGQIPNIKVFGTDYETEDGSCIRDYIHVLDLAKAHILALKALEKGVVGKFNVATGKGNSVMEVIKTAEQIVGKEIPKSLEDRREGDPPVLVANPQKIKKELGWTPQYNLKEIISSAWQWHKKHPKGFL